MTSYAQAPARQSSGAHAFDERRAVAGVLLFALLLRIEVIELFPHVIHPDEVFQATEQAYRLVFGYGTVPWEFREGARGWLWPGMLAGLMYALKWVFGSPAAGPVAVEIFCSVLSLTSVLVGYGLGRLTSRTHAVLGGFVAAIWVEMIYFAPHPLTEAIAANFLLAGLYFLSLVPTRNRAFIAGVLLGVCFIMRFHLAPAIAVAAIWYARGNVKARWLPLIAGGALPVAVYGVVDWLTWGMPFASIYENLHANLVDGRSQTYGVGPLTAYLGHILHKWSGASAVLIALIAIGSRKRMMWLAVSLTIILAHSFIAHKEYRFIFPAIACLILLAAMGTGDVLEFASRNITNARLERNLLPIAMAMWAFTSAALAVSPEFTRLFSAERPAVEAFNWARGQKSLCGLGLYGVPWFSTPGFSGLRRDVLLYENDSDDPREIAELSDAYNFALAPPKATLPSTFSVAKCFKAPDAPTLCMYHRTGACTPQPENDINHLLIKYKQ